MERAGLLRLPVAFREVNRDGQMDVGACLEMPEERALQRETIKQRTMNFAFCFGQQNGLLFGASLEMPKESCLQKTR